MAASTAISSGIQAAIHSGTSIDSGVVLNRGKRSFFISPHGDSAIIVSQRRYNSKEGSGLYLKHEGQGIYLKKGGLISIASGQKLQGFTPVQKDLILKLH